MPEMDLDQLAKPVQSRKSEGARGFVFAAEVGDEYEIKLKEIRAWAARQGKAIDNGSIAKAALNALHEQID